MLDERRAAILRAVVEGYIETAQPVGSSLVARSGHVRVSPATIRHEMVALEQDGYLAQPHTSAGRIPTDLGYRYYVDQLTAPGPLDSARRQQVSSFFASAHGALEDMLHQTSQLLSDLTDYAAVVVGPGHEQATVRSVQVVGIGHSSAVVVAVLSNGVVERATVDVPEDIGDDVTATASAVLSKALHGRQLTSEPTIDGTGDAAADQLCAAALSGLAAAHRDEPDQVFMGGVSRMASAFDAVDTVRRVLATLEQQYVVVSLLRDVIDRGLSVAIGAEHGLEPLQECSLVVAPYEVDHQPAGTIAVLGPTRMHYPEALAAVAVVSQRLGRHLGGN